jgi:hypothetical protein
LINLQPWVKYTLRPAQIYIKSAWTLNAESKRREHEKAVETNRENSKLKVISFQGDDDACGVMM